MSSGFHDTRNSPETKVVPVYPYTYTRYHNHVSTYRVNVNWLTKNASKGTYRLVYWGVKKDTLISYHKVVGTSSAFTLT